MVRNRRGCLSLPFAAQVTEIFISAGRTAGCYFCFIQSVSSTASCGPWRGGGVLQPHLSHSLTSDTCFSTNGKSCTSAGCVLPCYWQKQTVSENPTCALLSWERLEQGSEQMFGAALKFCTLFYHRYSNMNMMNWDCPFLLSAHRTHTLSEIHGDRWHICTYKCKQLGLCHQKSTCCLPHVSCANTCLEPVSQGADCISGIFLNSHSRNACFFHNVLLPLPL